MATVCRSIFVAGGGSVNNTYGAGDVLFSTASNQYAIITPNGSGNSSSVEINYGVTNQSVIFNPSTGTMPALYVPPSSTVSPNVSGVVCFTWVLFQSD